MIVKDIMSKNIISLSPEDSVQAFISLMEKNSIHEAIVVDKNKLVGTVRFRTLASKGGIFDATATKIKRVMESSCPKVSSEDTMEKAIEAILSGGTMILPVVENGIVVGMITMYDILKGSLDSKAFKNTKAEKLIVTPITITEETDIGKTRVLMREHGISRIPVVDKNNKLIGIVSVFDLLKSMRQPRERMNYYSMAAEMDRIMGISISSVMDKRLIVASPETGLDKIADIMLRNKTTGIIITKNDQPVGIITIKDLLEVLASGNEKQGIQYQMVGLIDEDDFIVDTVDRMLKNTVQKIEPIYNIQYFFMHVKKKETGLKSRISYSIRLRLMTDSGMFMSKASGWDLRDAVGDALENLERIVIKDKETLRERVLKNAKKLKGRLA